MSKAYRDPHDSYGLTIPDDWEYSVESHSVAFYHPNGVGALNVSAVRPPKGVVPKPESVILNLVSKSALEDGYVNVIALPSPHPTTRIAHAEYNEEGNAWRFWVLANDNLAVVFSYNCKLVSQGIEDAVIDEIIASTQLLARAKYKQH